MTPTSRVNKGAPEMKARPRRWRAFSRNTEGVAAVEFALIALPFFALLFAILETAFVFFAGQILDTGVYNASRLIRTGQAQNQSFTAAQFRDSICNEIFAILNCNSDIVVDVRTYTDFNDTDLTTPIDADGNFNLAPQYDPGGRNEIVVVRAFIEWPTFVPSLGNNLGNLASGNRLLAAATTFRNEPF